MTTTRLLVVVAAAACGSKPSPADVDAQPDATIDAPPGTPLLYPLAPSPSVLIVGVGAGHTQLEPPDGCIACGLCSPAGTADPAVVLAYATRYLTAFFARELLGDAAVGPAFDGALAPADVAAGRVMIMSK